MDGLRLTITVDLPGQKELRGVEWTVVESDLRAVLKDSIKRNIGGVFPFISFNQHVLKIGEQT